MDLSIIIVNYNVKYFLEHCLSSVIKAVSTISSEIFVVDNNSTDGSKEYFENKFSKVTFIYNSENVGFAKANNQALKNCTGKYILFLNPDTIVSEDCFTKCIAFLQNTLDCGALGVKMIDGAGNFLKESKRAFPSPLTSLYKLIGLTKLFPKSKKFANYHLGHLSQNDIQQVDVLAGAFLMTRKNILDTIGSFDEQFFMYGEDVDLSYRIQKAGWSNYYFANTTIIHFKGESTKRGSLNYIKMFYKAMRQFVQKHYGSTKAKTFNLFIQIAIFGRGVLSVVKNFLQVIGLPIIDFFIILFCIWKTKLYWFAYIKPEVRYNRSIVVTSAIIFAVIYILVGLIIGLYDKPYKQKRTNRVALISTLILLSLYGLSPENFRYSRGITVLSAFVIFIAITLFRWILIKAKIVEADTTFEEEKQTLVVSNLTDFNAIQNLYEKANIKERLLGQVDTEGNNGIIYYGQFKNVLKNFEFKNIVFSSNSLSFYKIINEVTQFKNYRIKFYSSNTNSIISSDGQNAIGESITPFGFFKLESASAKRSKRMLDLFSSLFFIIFSPLVFWFVQHKEKYLANNLQVLIGKKTYVGYTAQPTLPQIKPCIINQSNISKEPLAKAFAYELDYRYAKQYHYTTDIKIILRYFFS